MPRPRCAGLGLHQAWSGPAAQQVCWAHAQYSSRERLSEGGYIRLKVTGQSGQGDWPGSGVPAMAGRWGDQLLAAPGPGLLFRQEKEQDHLLPTACRGLPHLPKRPEANQDRAFQHPLEAPSQECLTRKWKQGWATGTKTQLQSPPRFHSAVEGPEDTTGGAGELGCRGHRCQPCMEESSAGSRGLKITPACTQCLCSAGLPSWGPDRPASQRSTPATNTHRGPIPHALHPPGKPGAATGQLRPAASSVRGSLGFSSRDGDKRGGLTVLGTRPQAPWGSC